MLRKSKGKTILRIIIAKGIVFKDAHLRGKTTVMSSTYQIVGTPNSRQLRGAKNGQKGAGGDKKPVAETYNLVL